MQILNKVGYHYNTVQYNTVGYIAQQPRRRDHGTKPTKGISLEFEIRLKFGVLRSKYTQPITMKFCTCHDSYTVVNS